MKVQKMVALVFLMVSFLSGCGECEKLRLNETDKDGLAILKKDNHFIIKVVSDTSNYFTTCNKLEVGEYQYEIFHTLFKIGSKNSYNGETPNVMVTTQEWL